MTYPHQESKLQREQDRDAFERKVTRIYNESDTWAEFKMKTAIANCWTFPLFSPFWHYYQHKNWKRAYTFVAYALWTIVWPIVYFSVICLLAVTGLINYACIAALIFLAMLGFVVFTYFWINLRIDMNDNHIENMIRDYKRRADSLAKNYIHI